ncbi:MAG: hypothetical protein ABJE95_04125 [Byssovorax sp.]
MARGSATHLAELGDRMLEALAKAPIDKVWAVAIGQGPSGARVTLGFNASPTALVDQRFSSKKALVKALTLRTPEVRSAALPLLAGVDQPAAAGFFAELVLQDLSGHADGSDGAAMAHAVGQVWGLLVDTLPSEKLVELWKAGRIRAEGLPPRAWELISPDAVAEMITQKRIVVDLLPKAVFERLPADLLNQLWLDGRIPADRLPEHARAQVTLEQLEAAYRQGVKASGIVTLVETHPRLQAPAEILAFLERLIGLVPEVVRGEGRDPRRLLRYEIEVLGRLVAALVKAKYREAVPAMKRLLALGDPQLFSPVLSGLGAIDALAAQQAAIQLLREAASGTLELDKHVAPAVVRAALAGDPAHASEALSPFFAPAALAAAGGRTIAAAILGVRARAFRLDTAPEPLFAGDPRWLDLGVRLLDEPGLDARAFLASFDPTEVSAALKRAGWKAPVPRAGARPPVPAKPRWIERYKKGEHEAVWSEIRALGASARDKAALGEIEKVTAEMMARVKKNLDRIVATLRKHGYAFQVPLKEALAPPGPKTAKAIADLEKSLEGPLPLALRAFYEVVGAVNLTENPDAVYRSDEAPFIRFGRLDPLVVVAPKAALDALSAARKSQTRYPAELRHPLTEVYLGADRRFKADPGTTEDDHPTLLDAAGEGADGVVHQGSRTLSFVDYLRQGLGAGGFLALSERPEAETQRERRLLTDGSLPF